MLLGIARRGALPKEIFTYKVKLMAYVIEIYNSDGKQWIIYTYSHSSMHFIECIKKNYVLLSQTKHSHRTPKFMKIYHAMQDPGTLVDQVRRDYKKQELPQTEYPVQTIQGGVNQ